MILSIPKNQLCQAFDPMMVIDKKTEQILSNPMSVNTSCVCPAYVYMEGSHGKRFLCDFHYFYEKNIIEERTPDQWPNICQYFINNLEEIKHTFPKTAKTLSVLLNEKCCNFGCSLMAYVRCMDKNNKQEHYCNFHYRKKYYRYLSNGINLEDKYSIVDERYNMKMSIEEEFESLTYL